MARTRSIVLGLEVCASKRADNACAHDRKNHPVPRGDTWLKVTDTGGMGRTKHYCVSCARKMLIEAKETIEDRLAELDAASPRDPGEAADT